MLSQATQHVSSQKAGERIEPTEKKIMGMQVIRKRKLSCKFSSSIHTSKPCCTPSSVERAQARQKCEK
jgi:hypothetical protein